MIVAVLKVEDGDWSCEGHIRDYKLACVIYFLKIKEIDIMIL